MAGNDRYTLEFGGELLPAMLHAVMIQRNSCMLDGKREMGRVLEEHYQALLKQAGIPNLSSVVDEDRWFAACTAMRSAKEYHWFTETRWKAPGNVSLVVDGKEFKLAWTLPADAHGIEEIKAFVERYAHVAAVRGEPQEHWKSYADLQRERAREAAGPDAAPEPTRAKGILLDRGHDGDEDGDDREFADDHDPDFGDDDEDEDARPGM
jgi:hypothetical protein